MLQRLSAAVRRLDFRPIQRMRGLPRQISTVHAAPLAAPHTSRSDDYPLPLKKRATMARRIPPVKPDNFSDSEPDEEVNMEKFPMEMGDERLDDNDDGDEGENEDGAPEVLGWMLEYDGHSEPDSGPAEEEEKENK